MEAESELPPDRGNTALDLLFGFAVIQLLIASVLPLWIVPAGMMMFKDLDAVLPAFTLLVNASYQAWPLIALIVAAGAVAWGVTAGRGSPRGKLAWVLLLLSLSVLLIALLFVSIGMPMYQLTRALS